MRGRFTITRRDGNSLAAELGVAGGLVRRLSAALQRRAAAETFHRQNQIRKSRSDSRHVGPGQEWRERRQHGEQMYQRPVGDGRGAARVSRRVPQAAMRRAGRWIFRMDRAEDRAVAGMVPSRGQPARPVRRTLRGMAERAGRVGDDVHDSMTTAYAVVADVSRSDAGDTGRSRRRRLDGPARADPLALKRLLVPAPADLLIATPVSPKINNVRNDSPELLEPAAQIFH